MAAKPRRLRWWYFRPWSPLLLGAGLGWFVAGLPPSIASSWQESIWDEHGAPLCGLVIGATIGTIVDFAKTAKGGKRDADEVDR